MSTVALRELARDIKDFVLFKRTLGRRYETAEYTLKRFQRFATQHAKDSRIELEPVIHAWIKRPGARSRTTISHQFGTVRELCLYRRRRDLRSYVPDRSLAPRRGPKFLPQPLSHAQVRRLLEVARSYSDAAYEGEMLHLLCLMLYCMGLRPGEPRRIRMADLDRKARTVLIRESKEKTRIVPFGADLALLIERYVEKRAQLKHADPDGSLLVDREGRELSARRLSKVMGKLWRRTGLKPARGRSGARTYDLRHAFAVHRLTDWYRKGADLHARLPWLSAYMGHDDLLGTETYLHATPQLLRAASRRFAKRFKEGSLS